ncbi:NAD(P)/FAD-dependent oxidoreductase [Amycolatopsis thailandensis]|uniref:NAD(P)/FAD-dependent oxidoreductase n=1 Tax=Amycolatopsis thailandensis TaxID=589330 RepID=UPI00362E39DE
MTEVGKHAMVIGASLAGLIAARALADSFAKVTVVERDRLPCDADSRQGVPQDKHLHGLLAAGSEALEDLFPGLRSEMLAAGAVPADLQSDVHWYVDGHLLDPKPSGIIGLTAGRPLVDWLLRKKVAALPNVEIKDDCDVLGLSTSTDRQRVIGAQIKGRASGVVTDLETDLVVDAGGRGSRSSVFMEEWGYRRPPESKMTVDIIYVTRTYRREERHLAGRVGIAAGPFPGSPRGGFLLAQENDKFLFTVSGVFGEEPPMDDEGLLAFANSLPSDDFTKFLLSAERISEPVRMRYPASVWRHYEKLSTLPAGYLVVGDALCSFNPVYGQGMTVAAIEGVLLRDLLKNGEAHLARRFYAAAAKPIGTAWSLVTGGDSRHPQSGVTPRLSARLLNRYMARLYRVASRDAVVANAFIRVLNLMDTPDRLVSPRVLLRVFARSKER